MVQERDAESAVPDDGLVGEQEASEDASVRGGALGGVVGHEHPADLRDGGARRDVAVGVVGAGGERADVEDPGAALVDAVGGPEPGLVTSAEGLALETRHGDSFLVGGGLLAAGCGVQISARADADLRAASAVALARAGSVLLPAGRRGVRWCGAPSVVDEPLVVRVSERSMVDTISSRSSSGTPRARRPMRSSAATVSSTASMRASDLPASRASWTALSVSVSFACLSRSSSALTAS